MVIKTIKYDELQATSKTVQHCINRFCPKLAKVEPLFHFFAKIDKKKKKKRCKIRPVIRTRSRYDCCPTSSKKKSGRKKKKEKSTYHFRRHLYIISDIFGISRVHLAKNRRRSHWAFFCIKSGKLQR